MGFRFKEEFRAWHEAGRPEISEEVTSAEQEIIDRLMAVQESSLYVEIASAHFWHIVLKWYPALKSTPFQLRVGDEHRYYESRLEGVKAYAAEVSRFRKLETASSLRRRK